MRNTILSLFLAASLTAVAQSRATMTPAQRAEKMFGYVINNQADSLYANLTRQLKPIMPKQQLEGILLKAEEKYGRYKSHSPWEVQEMSGSNSCTSTVQFEKEQLGALIVFDPSGFLLGVQIVPKEAIKK